MQVVQAHTVFYRLLLFTDMRQILYIKI